MKRVASIAPALIVALLLAVGIFYSINLLVRPKPIAKLKPTSFEKMEQIGAVAYLSLKRELRNNKLVILGSSPWVQDYEQIWSGLMLRAYGDKNFPKLLMQDPVLKSPILIKEMEVREISETINADEVSQSSKSGELHFLHTVFSQSTSVFEESFFNRIEAATTKNILSISLVPLAVTEKELGQINPSCPIDEIAETDLEQLGCIVKRTSKRFFRKKLDPNKVWALMEQHGSNEYLLFVHQPGLSYSGESF